VRTFAHPRTKNQQVKAIGQPQDRNVPILVVLPGQHRGSTVFAPVETTQIAPTVLTLLGLSPDDL